MIKWTIHFSVGMKNIGAEHFVGNGDALKDIFHRYADNKHLIGIGTGRTMKQFSKYLPDDRIYVTSSLQSELFLKRLNTTNIINHSQLDVYFDSADYYNPNGDLIKGGGGAMVLERLLMEMSDKTVIIVQESKKVTSFSDLLVPIEIIKSSLEYFKSILETRKLKYKMRENKGFLPFITDMGNFIIDVEFNMNFIMDCNNITGVVGHGLFIKNDKITIEEIDN